MQSAGQNDRFGRQQHGGVRRARLRTIQKVEAAARTRTARRMRKIFFIGDFDAAVIEAAS
jgi:hypothetical protein